MAQDCVKNELTAEQLQELNSTPLGSFFGMDMGRVVTGEQQAAVQQLQNAFGGSVSY